MMISRSLTTNLKNIEAQNGHDPLDVMMSDYEQLRKLYLLARNAELETFLGEKSKNEYQYDIIAIGYLRLAIRTGLDLEKRIIEVEKKLESFGSFRPEATLVLAMAYETLKQDQHAKDLYLEAHRLFSDIGNLQKAAASYHNAIAADSRLFPAKRRLFEYNHAAQLALEAGDFATYGAALNNMARDLQLEGAIRNALEKTNEAFEVLAKHHFGSYQYFLTLANRCHILINLNQISQARIDLEAFRLSSFEEHKAIVRTLSALLGEPTADAGNVNDALTPVTWKKRQTTLLAERYRDQKLTTSESNLLSILATGRKTKIDLITELYGVKKDILDFENRLKQILFRVRRKIPGVIVFRGDHYELV